jgi:hypothetical protein
MLQANPEHAWHASFTITEGLPLPLIDSRHSSCIDLPIRMAAAIYISEHTPDLAPPPYGPGR